MGSEMRIRRLIRPPGSIRLDHVPTGPIRRPGFRFCKGNAGWAELTVSCVQPGISIDIRER
jgi:hypothetical protein